MPKLTPEDLELIERACRSFASIMERDSVVKIAARDTSAVTDKLDEWPVAMAPTKRSA